MKAKLSSNKTYLHNPQSAILINHPKNYSVITHTQLQEIKAKCNLFPQGSQISKAAEEKRLLQEKSLHLSSKWKDNIMDLKKRKQQQRYKKFQEQQMRKRKIDQAQFQYQQQIRKQILKNANTKIFNTHDRVKALNSILLLADTLAERQQQLKMKQIQKNMEKVILENSHQQVLVNMNYQQNIRMLEEQEKRKKEIERQKIRLNEITIKKQHKQMKKKYINELRQDKIQGQLIKEMAIKSIKQDQQKLQQKRKKAISLNLEIKKNNEQNLRLKQIEDQKQKQEDRKIEQRQRKYNLMIKARKNKEKEIQAQKVRIKQYLIQKRIKELSQQKNKEEERLNNQLEKMRLKEQKELEDKNKWIDQMKKNVEQSRKNIIEKKKYEKIKQNQQQLNFKQTWKQFYYYRKNINKISQIQKQQKQIYKQLIKQNNNFIKKQIAQKQSLRQQEIIRQLEQEQNVRRIRENQNKQFSSWAQKCIKEWKDNGKNVYPMMKTISKLCQ